MKSKTLILTLTILMGVISIEGVRANKCKELYAVGVHTSNLCNQAIMEYKKALQEKDYKLNYKLKREATELYEKNYRSYESSEQLYKHHKCRESRSFPPMPRPLPNN